MSNPENLKLITESAEFPHFIYGRHELHCVCWVPTHVYGTLSQDLFTRSMNFNHSVNIVWSTFWLQKRSRHLQLCTVDGPHSCQVQKTWDLSWWMLIPHLAYGRRRLQQPSQHSLKYIPITHLGCALHGLREPKDCQESTEFCCFWVAFWRFYRLVSIVLRRLISFCCFRGGFWRFCRVVSIVFIMIQFHRSDSVMTLQNLFQDRSKTTMSEMSCDYDLKFLLPGKALLPAIG